MVCGVDGWHISFTILGLGVKSEFETLLYYNCCWFFLVGILYICGIFANNIDDLSITFNLFRFRKNLKNYHWIVMVHIPKIHQSHTQWPFPKSPRLTVIGMSSNPKILDIEGWASELVWNNTYTRLTKRQKINIHSCSIFMAVSTRLKLSFVLLCLKTETRFVPPSSSSSWMSGRENIVQSIKKGERNEHTYHFQADVKHFRV